jgi:small conductance mechanosensitive channel
MGWSRANVDVLISLDADLERALAVMAEEGEALANDPQWAETIVEPPQVLGIESMSADGYTIRVTARTAPLQQDPFARALRARIGARLRREGIALAKPPAVASPGPAGSADQPSSEGV